MTFNPKDDGTLCTTGRNHFKIWRIIEGQLKQAQQLKRMKENHFFTEHCWLDRHKLVACTKVGEVFYLENYEMLQEIDSAFSADDNSYVVALEKFQHGFYVASDQGDMAMWVRSEENNSTSGKKPLDFIRKWQPASTKG